MEIFQYNERKKINEVCELIDEAIECYEESVYLQYEDNTMELFKKLSSMNVRILKNNEIVRIVFSDLNGKVFYKEGGMSFYYEKDHMEGMLYISLDNMEEEDYEHSKKFSMETILSCIEHVFNESLQETNRIVEGINNGLKILAK